MANKTQEHDGDVRAYLETVEHEGKRADSFALVDMMEDITGEDARMWGSSIVGFGRYQYQYANGSMGESMLVGFAPRKANLVLYIMAGFDNYDALLEKLGKHKTGKACLYIKKLADVDEAILRELITESVEHMKATHPPESDAD